MQGQFTNPIGVEINSLGHVYVADRGVHRIQIFEQEGLLFGDANNDCYFDFIDFAINFPVAGMWKPIRSKLWILAKQLS